MVAVAVTVGAVAVVRLVVLAADSAGYEEFWYDTALGMAPTVSILLAASTGKAIRALGGFDLLHFPQQLLAARSAAAGSHPGADGDAAAALSAPTARGTTAWPSSRSCPP